MVQQTFDFDPMLAGAGDVGIVAHQSSTVPPFLIVHTRARPVASLIH